MSFEPEIIIHKEEEDNFVITRVLYVKTRWIVCGRACE